ncbi:helix-turn-helix transcriptional regulator [Geobacillus stearothermophilus]|uniref:helix-turn-helix transcriptional regulator n=1 Tax=Geobacillus stearothermophilus TaxID=1422 RepID=UPI002E24B584|nr:helix-turn-helix transcriptional regulator [Geobacillus stearothermophilus]
MRLSLNIEKLEQLQKQRNWSDTELAKRIGVSRSRLWRAKLPKDHPYYCYPGETFIAGVLKAFPEVSFEEIFFLDDLCSGVHKEETR